MILFQAFVTGSINAQTFLIESHVKLRRSSPRPINQSKTTDQYVNESSEQTQTKKRTDHGSVVGLQQ